MSGELIRGTFVKVLPLESEAALTAAMSRAGRYTPAPEPWFGRVLVCFTQVDGRLGCVIEHATGRQALVPFDRIEPVLPLHQAPVR